MISYFGKLPFKVFYILKSMNKKCYVFYNVFVNICLTVKKLRIKVLDWVSISLCLVD